MNRVIIEFDYLCKNFTQEKWFQTLEILWAPLRYRNFPKLMQLGWDTVALGKLNSVALAELSVDLQLNPWSYLVPDRNRYNLPAIPIANIPVLNHLFGTEIGEVDIKCIQFYHKVSEFVQEHKQISLNANQYFAEIAENEGFSHEIRIATLAPRRKLVKPHWEQNSGIEETRYYRAHELEALLRLPLHFNRLYRSSVRSIPRPKSKNQLERNSKIWENFDPNPQQLECYNRLQKHNVLLIDGGPGSGKSTVMQILRTLFADSVVGFFAAYGVIANGLSEKLNIEFSTLAMAVDQIERNTSGASAFLRMEVAFIDEISLVDVILLDKFLSVMTGLKVLVMAGDYCQSSCIGPGPIIYGMLKKWTGTPYVQQLVKFYRTKNPILLDNLDKLRKGRYDIQYSTRLDSDHPFIIQQRHEIPKEIQKTFTQAARLAYVSILMKDIEPIYRYYMEHDPSVLDNAMLCTQRIHDVSLLNHAWWCIKFNKNVAQDHYSETEFTVGETVMFCGNNLNDPDYQRAAHLRSSRVMHGSTAVILAIWDFLPYWNGEGDVYRGARSVISTSETKEYYMDRVIQFTNGTQINLRDYPLSNFKRGYAVTTSSTQGLQCELLIYYVQPGRTRYLTRQEFYTGCSRSKTRVIIICEANSESLHTSDLARISRNEFRLQFDIIPIYLPPFKEKVEQDEWAEVAGNPFENLPSSKPTEEIVQVLSNSSLFGGFFAGLKLVGSTIIDETAQSGF